MARSIKDVKKKFKEEGVFYTGDYYIEQALKLLNEYKEKRAAVKQNQ